MEFLHIILIIAIMIISVPFIVYIIAKPIWYIFDKLFGPFI